MTFSILLILINAIFLAYNVLKDNIALSVLWATSTIIAATEIIIASNVTTITTVLEAIEKAMP